MNLKLKGLLRMTKTIVEQFVSSQEGMRSFQQETAIYEITELIEDRLRDMGISRSELAMKLGKTKGWVTQLLDGESNKTIRTVADVFAVLGRSLHFSDVPLELAAPAVSVISMSTHEWLPPVSRWTPSFDAAKMNVKVKAG